MMLIYLPLTFVKNLDAFAMEISAGQTRKKIIGFTSIMVIRCSSVHFQFGFNAWLSSFQFIFHAFDLFSC